jgi:hypothetical protein
MTLIDHMSELPEGKSSFVSAGGWYSSISFFNCDDLDNAVLAGDGYRSPVGILNTPGINVLHVSSPDEIPSHLFVNAVIAHPDARDVLPEKRQPLLYTEHCSGSGGPYIISGDLSTCRYARGRKGELAFTAVDSNLTVIGGWA